MAKAGPEPIVTDEELIDAIRGAENPFVTASSLSDTVDLSRERIRQRLNRLNQEGEIERAKIGGGVVIYWLSESN